MLKSVTAKYVTAKIAAAVGTVVAATALSASPALATSSAASAQSATASSASTASVASTAKAAASGQSYSDSLVFVGPDVQQTNLTYYGPWVNSTVTPTGPITNLAWQWAFNNTQPANTTLNLWVCGINASTGAGACAGAGPSYGSTTIFNGWPGNSKFRLQYQLTASSTYVIKPTSFWGARDYIWPTFTQN